MRRTLPRPTRRAALRLLGGAAGLIALPGATEAAHPRVQPFVLPALDGGRVDVGDWLGEDVLLIAFWATWCACCLEELPKLDAFARQRSDQGLRLIAINIDPPAQHTRAASQIRRIRFQSTSLVDPEGRVVDRYNKQKKTPTLLLVDRRALLRKTFVGYSPTEQTSLAAEIDALLAETGD